MIDLSGFDQKKLLEGLTGLSKIAEQTSNLISSINIDEVKAHMTPNQLKDYHKAKSGLDAVKNKNWDEIFDLSKKFNT